MQQNESLFDNRVYINTGTTSVEQMHFFQGSCHLTEQKSSSENIWQDITLKKKKVQLAKLQRSMCCVYNSEVLKQTQEKQWPSKMQTNQKQVCGQKMSQI